MKNKRKQKNNKAVSTFFLQRDLFSDYFRGSFLDDSILKNFNFSVVHLETDGGRINAICPNFLIAENKEAQDLLFKIEIIESKEITIKYQNEDIVVPLVFICKIANLSDDKSFKITDNFDEMDFSKNIYKKISNELKEISTKGSSSIIDIKTIEKIVSQYTELRKNPADLKNLETSNDNIIKFLDYLCDYYDNLTYIENFDTTSLYEKQFDIIQIVDDGKKLKHIFSLYFKDGLSCKIIDLNNNNIQYFDVDLFSIFEYLNNRLEIYYHIKAKDNQYSKFYKEFFRECFVPASTLTKDLKFILDSNNERKEKLLQDPKYIDLIRKTSYISNYSLNLFDYSKYNLDLEVNEKPCESSIFSQKIQKSSRDIEASFFTISRYLQILEDSMLKYIHCNPEDKDLDLERMTSKLGLNRIFDRFTAELANDITIPEERKNLIISYKFEIIKNRNYLYHIFLIEFLKIFNSSSTLDINKELEPYIKKLNAIEKFTLYSYKSLFPEDNINAIYNYAHSSKSKEIEQKHYESNTLLANYYFHLSTLYLKIENRLYYLLEIVNNKMDDSQKFSKERIYTMRKYSIGEYINLIQRLPKIYNNNYLLIACSENGIDFNEFVRQINTICRQRNYWIHKSLLDIDLFNKSNAKHIHRKLMIINNDYDEALSALNNIDKLIDIFK